MDAWRVQSVLDASGEAGLLEFHLQVRELEPKICRISLGGEDLSERALLVE
jgi:hypothetical protein